ncbi:MAG: phytanoyl-CoA dioxygenase family protein, partial [Pseudomonadota bacterium]
MSRTARSILLWPFHLGALFSQAKSFRDNPILGSRTLNRLGLHVARVALAHAIVGLRRRVFLFWLVDAETRRAFARDGYVEIRNFVPPERLAALRAEIQACRVETRAMQQGDTATVTVLLDDTALADLPACRELLDSPAFFNPLAYVGARWKHALAFIHVVKNANAGGARDPQKTFHSDTFHSTMKAWLFLEDVAEEEGPFNYVPGSHR